MVFCKCTKGQNFVENRRVNYQTVYEPLAQRDFPPGTPIPKIGRVPINILGLTTIRMDKTESMSNPHLKYTVKIEQQPSCSLSLDKLEFARLCALSDMQPE